MTHQNPDRASKRQSSYWRRRDLIENSGLSAPDRMLLDLLSNYQGENVWAWPNVELLAKKLSRHFATVCRRLTWLKNQGLVIRERRKDRRKVHDSQWRYSIDEAKLASYGSGERTLSVFDPKRSDDENAQCADDENAQCADDVFVNPPGPPYNDERPEETPIETLKERVSPPTGGVPPELRALIDRWNALPAGIVGHQAKHDPPSKAVLEGWSRVQRDPEFRDCFRDLDRLFEAIEKAKFFQGQGWFALDWLFGQKNRLRNVVKITEGRYRDDNQSKDRQANTRQVFDPDSRGGDI